MAATTVAHKRSLVELEAEDNAPLIESLARVPRAESVEKAPAAEEEPHKPMVSSSSKRDAEKASRVNNLHPLPGESRHEEEEEVESEEWRVIGLMMSVVVGRDLKEGAGSYGPRYSLLFSLSQILTSTSSSSLLSLLSLPTLSARNMFCCVPIETAVLISFHSLL